MITETWYILEDGAVGDPRAISPDENGILRHKDGRAVAYAPHGPRSRGGVDAEVERAKAAAAAPVAARQVPVVDDRELVAERPAERVKRPYKTRESKVG